MKPRDLALIAFVCLVWAFHTIIAKIVVSGMGIPPVFYAALRFVIVALIALPWLLPPPYAWWRMALVGFLIGGASFALFFLGIRDATPSSASIVGQLGLPITAVLSVVMLGERLDRRRILGTALTFLGVLIVMWQPGGFAFSGGLLFVAGSAFVGALGAILMKRMTGVKPLQFQAWVGVGSALPLALLTLALEDNQIPAAQAAGWGFVAALLYSAVLTSIVAHSVYYLLIARYEASLVAPGLILTPVMAVALGVMVTGDPFGPRMAIGSAIALAGVLIVSLQPGRLRFPSLRR